MREAGLRNAICARVTTETHFLYSVLWTPGVNTPKESEPAINTRQKEEQMAIYKRGNTYWFEFTFEGQRIRRSTKTKNAKVARDIEAAHRIMLAKEGVGIKPRRNVPTLKEFVETRVMPTIRAASVAHPRTAEFYEDSFNRVLSHARLASARLDCICDELIDSFKRSELTKVSVNTTNHSLGVLRRALRIAYADQLIDRLPAIQKVKGARERTFVLSGALRDEFIAGLPEPCRTVAAFLCDTGLRISECCNLTWDRVFFVDNQPGIHGFITIDRGKSKHSRRTVPLTKVARAILERQKQLSKSQFVFVRVGGRVDRDLWYTAAISRFTVSEQFSKRRDELGLPWDAVLHSTRHTAGTDLGASGANAFTIQKFLGHPSVTISQRYVHPGDPVVLASIQQLELHREREAQSRQPQLSVANRGAGA